VPLYFIQMAGVPGSGKSTIARGLYRKLGAIVIDHDITKSALLAAGIPEKDAGRASYSVLDALSDSILSQGHSLIFDSPCLYDDLLRRGMATASRFSAAYRYIECQPPDMETLSQRLASREARPSQIQHLDQSFSHAGAPPVLARDLVAEWASSMKRPSSDYLILDTGESVDSCIRRAIAYVIRDS
jgi:predicted kinase